jgi:hypothetical protein
VICRRMSAKVALVLDCDDTLAEDTTSQLLLLSSLSEDVDKFYSERVTSRVTRGWDPPLAVISALLELLLFE